jgi:hypothetical protein
MKNALEYEAEYDGKGRVVRKRLYIGPVLITTAAGLVLSMSGHTVWAGLASLWKAVRWW